MNKPELIDLLSDRVDITKKQAENFIEVFTDIIVEALKNDDKVLLSGFGIFETHTRKERVGRNPSTGEEIVISANKNVVFRPSKQLKDVLN